MRRPDFIARDFSPSPILQPKRPLKVRPNHFAKYWAGPDGKPLSLVDFNRSGAPLMEIVTDPDVRSAEAARAYAEELQLLLRTVGASDADMERGQMRVEANVSLRPRGTEAFGIRIEVKNMNSFRSVERAVATAVDDFMQRDLFDLATFNIFSPDTIPASTRIRENLVTVQPGATASNIGAMVIRRLSGTQEEQEQPVMEPPVEPVVPSGVPAPITPTLDERAYDLGTVRHEGENDLAFAERVSRIEEEERTFGKEDSETYSAFRTRIIATLGAAYPMASRELKPAETEHLVEDARAFDGQGDGRELGSLGGLHQAPPCQRVPWPSGKACTQQNGRVSTRVSTRHA